MDNNPGTSKSPPIKKKRLTDQEIFNLIENPLSSDEDFDLSSDTDLGEGDSADDDVDFEEPADNAVGEMIFGEIDDNNVTDTDDPIIDEVSPLRLDEENSETGTLSPPLISPPTTRHRIIKQPTTRVSAPNYNWLDHSPNLDTINFHENVGLKIRPDGDQPIDFFNLLLTNDFFEFVVRETNNYATDLYMNRSSDKSRITKWVDTNVNELKIFFGLLLHTGTIKLPKMSEYWKTDELFNLNCFREKMSRNRYMLIMRVLHFCKNPETDEEVPSRIYKVEKVLDFFNKRMQEIYQPSENLSLDESMVLWRGRLVFRQYIKNKRHKYGVKLYMLTEHQGLVQQIMIYSGQGTGVLPGVSHTEYVVEKLMDNYLDKGYSLFMDNYYNSVQLAHKLLKRKTYCTGTLRTNRRDNPKEVVTRKLKPGESVGKYTKDGICVVKWKDRRDVLSISSKFKNEMVETTNRHGQKKIKPLAIAEYNKYMSGIDRQDQMMSYYPAERKTLLIKALLSYKSDPVPLIRPQISERHFPCKVEKNHKNRYIRKRCRLCASTGKREETIYYCNKCDSQPGLCLDPCFENFHKKL
ncbi:piggyBac transposable element-derived protein 4-like [Rhopalosiphum padi]|uniref:piggyBac transposable element-derived protein 4-like n=1 Tax=Rhopalosiphum padi TaxID=40932 RepID=UPI00298DA999|nr:piggyBac transposable element-derived protein 4-like [Rhopalosiphum padi]